MQQQQKTDFLPSIDNDYIYTTEAMAGKLHGKPFSLFPFQKDIFNAVVDNKRVVVIASRQIGKTESLVRLALAKANLEDEQLILLVSAGERQASEVLTRLKAALYAQVNPKTGKNLKVSLKKESATEIQIEDTKSRILSLPNSPNTIRGYPANLLIIDEVDSIENWEDFVSAIFPSVSSTDGTIVCSGTYQGKKQLYNLTQDKSWVLCGPFTWEVNPPKDIAQQEHDLTKPRFNQEYNCEAIDSLGTLFPYSILEQCEDESLVQSPKKNENSLYFGGYDPAKLADPSIVQTLELLEDDYRCRLIDTKDLALMDYSVQAGEIKVLHLKYGYHSLAVDRTGAIATFELVEGAIGSVAIDITFSRTVKEKLINNLRIAFQDKKIIIPNDPILMKELHDLDPNTLDHRSGGTSDRCWALALAWECYLRYAARAILKFEPQYTNIM